MSIPLTCSCGQKIIVSPSWAGRTYSCPACQNAIIVPALGILEPATRRRRDTAPSTGIPVGFWLVLAVLAILLGGTAYYLTQPRPAIHEPEVLSAELAPLPTPLDPAAPDIRPATKPDGALKPAPQPIAGEPVRPELVGPPARLPDETPITKPVVTDPPPKKPALIGGPIRLEWKLCEGDTFLQELIVAQKPSFRMQGITFNSVLQYRVLSRFTVQKALKDGSLVVTQKVEEAKLLQADDLTRGILAGPVAKLPGTAFTIHLNSAMDVTKFEGGEGGPLVAKLPAGQGMQMASLMDMDGWKEMAQATFFQPGKGLDAGERWSKPMTHNWGPLGAWAGKIHYTHGGNQKDVHKVDYALELAYQPPKAGGGIMGLPIGGARFNPPQAGGAILFDAVAGKVTAAEERFRVRGQITLNLLGQNTVVEIEEEQQFSLRILDGVK